MVLGFGTLTFNLAHCHSLKEKRSIVKSIIARTRNTFNAAVAEVDSNGIHERAVIGFAFVGNDQRKVNSDMDKMIEFIDRLSLAEIIDSQMEIFHS